MNPVNVITISREYGSRGTAVATALAEGLEWRYVDDDLVFLVAHRAGINDQKVRAYDQEGFTRLRAFAQDCVAMLESITPTVIRPTAGPLDAPGLRVQPRRLYSARYFHLAQQMIRALAAHGHVVIMGRGAQLVLRDVPGTLHVRIVAPFEARVRRVANNERMDARDAARRIRRRDESVARYLRHFYGVDWNDPLLCHLILNTGLLNDTEAVRLILTAASGVNDGVAARDTSDSKRATRPAAERVGTLERPS